MPALGAIGAARVNLGDPGGLPDLERCIAIYQEHGSPASIDWQNNLAFSLAILGDLHRCFLVRHAASTRPSATDRLGPCTGWSWSGRASTTGTATGTKQQPSPSP